MIRSACILLALTVAAPALADPSLDIAFDDDPGYPGDVGIDNCQQRILESFTLVGRVTFDTVVDTRTPIMRLYYYTGDAVCTRETGLLECERGTDSDSAPCGCLHETNSLSQTNTFSVSTTLAQALGDAVQTLCTSGAPTAVRFASELYYPQEGDLSAESHVSEQSEAITIDRTRPLAPTDPPTVSSGENALIVRVAELSSVEEYEVCVRQVGSQGTPSDAETVSNTTLREGFTRCVTPSDLPDDSYRFTGLTNDVNYEVVYAGIDGADNRGPNSPAAEGRPQAQRDFAEQYTAQLGGAAGETGGCAAAPGRSTSGLALAVLGLLALVRRRRT